MPQAAYDPSRKQYDAQAVVDEISNHIIVALTNERALIVTDADLYTPELNFVFGLADPKKGVCIISLARLKTDSTQALFNERALKEAAHELGHSWNVPHCPDRRCVMFFSNSLADTDRKQDHFCYKCRIGLDNRHGSGGMLGKKIEKIMSR
jgi:archaemetzincin